jgi:hypothetical protein
MRDTEWDIRRGGRAWAREEFRQRTDLMPEKLEVWQGKLLWEDDERVQLLGLLLENLGADNAVRLGNIEIWRDAIATRWLRDVKGADPAYRARLREWAQEFIQSMVKSNMESLRVEVEIASPITGARRVVSSVLVNADAMLSWIPAEVLEAVGIERRKVWQFLQRDGSILERSTGSVIVQAAGVETIDEVVFGEPGDPVVLGARSLDGLNLRIDPLNRRLVDAGPAPAALAGWSSALSQE